VAESTAGGGPLLRRYFFLGRAFTRRSTSIAITRCRFRLMSGLFSVADRGAFWSSLHEINEAYRANDNGRDGPKKS
jgi:hypothetical protein